MARHPPHRTPGPEREERRADEAFLERWSRRKQASRDPPATAEPAPAAAPPRDADLPPVDSLDAGSDVSGFLSPEVSESLRRAALRRVFSLPVYNVTDGLDDYAEDYTEFRPLGDLITAGLRDRMEREARQTLSQSRLEPAAEDFREAAAEDRTPEAPDEPTTSG